LSAPDWRPAQGSRPTRFWPRSIRFRFLGLFTRKRFCVGTTLNAVARHNSNNF
jgi:hypothetical protein